MALFIIPTSDQSLDETRDPIRNNFINIDTGFSVNHAPLNSGGNSGFHTAINFLNQTPAPAAPTTAALQSMIYAAPGILTNATSALFAKGASQGATVNGAEFTAISAATNQGLANTVPSTGFTVLPSGIMLQWGYVNLVGADSLGTPVTFPTPFPTACLNVQLTMESSIGGQSRVAYVVTGSRSQTNFLGGVKNSTSNNRNDGTVNYLAIGY
jgi:hypothetical protein